MMYGPKMGSSDDPFFLFIDICFYIFCTAVSIFIIYKLVKYFRFKFGVPVFKKTARVINKRHETWQDQDLPQTRTQFFVKFEPEDKTIVELPVPLKTYNSVSLQDKGVLTWKGHKFISFINNTL